MVAGAVVVVAGAIVVVVMAGAAVVVVDAAVVVVGATVVDAVAPVRTSTTWGGVPPLVIARPATVPPTASSNPASRSLTFTVSVYRGPGPTVQSQHLGLGAA